VAQRYDAVIIGGGHNGLTTAAYLAKAGWKTLVLEKRRILGGATTSDEIVPGYTFSVLSYVVSLLRPEIIRDLELAKHGLEILPLDGTFTPLHGDYLWRRDDHAATMREIRRWSATDADAYEEYGQLMADMARFVKPILGMVPPDPTSIDPRDWLGVLGLGRDFARLPERQQAAFLGLMTMSAADFLDQWFETEPLKATMSASGIIGTFLGVRSPGTAYVLLHHYMGEIDGAFRAWGLQKGGTGAISYAIASAARALGVEIRTEAGVSRVTLTPSGDRATGVVLESGEEIAANVVISSADVRRTFLQFLEPGILPEDFEAQVRRFKFRGSSGKVNLALDALPTFTTNPGGTEYLRGAVSISPSLEHMERAYDDALHRHRLPQPRGPVRGAAGQARHELLRPVRALGQVVGRAGLGQPEGGLRERGDRPGQRVRAEPEGCHRREARGLAARHGTRLGPDRGQHLPR
jgi:phytoene dehydrogenase-like protein